MQTNKPQTNPIPVYKTFEKSHFEKIINDFNDSFIGQPVSKLKEVSDELLGHIQDLTTLIKAERELEPITLTIGSKEYLFTNIATAFDFCNSVQQNCESKWSVLIIEEEGNCDTKPCIIDTGEHYYELDEEGKLYRNGVLVATHVKSIFRIGQSANCLSFSTPPSWVDTILGKTCNNDNWLLELIKEDTDHDRDYLNRWTTGPALPIKVGESVVGMAYFDNGKDQDYSVTITDPDFLGRISAVQEVDGRMRTRDSDHSYKRAGGMFGRQFIGRGRITSKGRHIPPKPVPMTTLSKEEIDTYQCDFYIRPRNKGEGDGD